MSRVQLLVGDEGNRNALASLVRERFSVDTASELDDADLYLVDDRTFPSYHDELSEHKRREHPTFCPVVLIHREDTRINVALPDPDSDGDEEFRLIDDAVTAPIDRTTLFQRMDNLLARREQSIELTRRYERTQARFRGLFQTIPDPAFVVGDEGEITAANEAFCDLAETEREQLLETDPSDLDVFRWEDRSRLSRLIGGEEPDDADSTVEERLVEVDDGGRRQYLEVRHQTRFVAGEPSTVVVMHDVTDLKVSNEQLEDFASIVTHDLRNPMNVAMARSQMLRENLSEEMHADRDLTLIQDSLDRMDELIAGVRTLVRETEVSETETVELESLAREAWRNVETPSNRLRCVDVAVGVVTDRRRLLQLFENLFRNAVDHGGSDVSIEVGRIEDEGFYVADDGPGIPADHREEVLNSGFTTSESGTGFGLKIVSEIATAHGWGVTVTESDDGGARFEITGVEFDAA